MEPYQVTGTGDLKTMKVILIIIFMVLILSFVPVLILEIRLGLFLFNVVLWSSAIVGGTLVWIHQLRLYLMFIKEKTLVIDDLGVRLVSGKKTFWDVRWSVMVEARITFPGFACIVISTKDGKFDLNSDEHIGPRDKVKNAFQIISDEARRRGIAVLDLRSPAPGTRQPGS